MPSPRMPVRRCGPPSHRARAEDTPATEKLVIAVPTVMAAWTQAYGPAKAWFELPANLLVQPAPSATAAPAAFSATDAASRPSETDRPHSLTNGDAPNTMTPASASPQGSLGGPFYCDPCQRSFAQAETYEAHMQTHIYCAVPGCHFTCRDNRPWRMQEHMDMLHNRPDAPNLADTGAYIDQRKRRFPTQDAIKGKVEELYYKAARGVVLPDERRRWMRQHGIDIRKRPRTEGSFIAKGELPEGSRSPSAASSASKSASRSPSSQPEPVPASDTPSRAPATPATPLAAEAVTKAPAVDSTPSAPSATPAHPAKIIPLGPNGTLTPRQRVQLVRERYAAAQEVPQFYVCQRCGRKGEHWVANCPTRGDTTFDRHVVWGEAKMAAADTAGPKAAVSKDRPERAEETTSATFGGSTEELTLSETPAPVTYTSVPPSEREAPPPAPALEAVDADDDAPPVPQPATAPAGVPREATRMLAPVAAAKRAQPNRREHGRRPPPPPTLYERLTEEERLSEQGVLLQAMRFFAARDFFQEKK